MPKNIPTTHENLLASALVALGIRVEQQHWDGHKHIDIFIPEARIYIEVDGVPHYTHPDQLVADFSRDYYSFKQGFFTKHITNEAIDTHLDQIANAIAQIVKSGRVLP